MTPEENVTPELPIDEEILTSEDNNKDNVILEEKHSLPEKLKEKESIKIDDYLSPEILSVKSYSQDDSLVINDVDLNSDNLDESIYNNFRHLCVF